MTKVFICALLLLTEAAQAGSGANLALKRLLRHTTERTGGSNHASVARTCAQPKFAAACSPDKPMAGLEDGSIATLSVRNDSVAILSASGLKRQDMVLPISQRGDRGEVVNRPLEVSTRVVNNEEILMVSDGHLGLGNGGQIRWHTKDMSLRSAVFDSHNDSTRTVYSLTSTDGHRYRLEYSRTQNFNADNPVTRDVHADFTPGPDETVTALQSVDLDAGTAVIRGIRRGQEFSSTVPLHHTSRAPMVSRAATSGEVAHPAAVK